MSADIKLSEKEQLALQAQTQWALNLIRSNHYLKNEIQTIRGSQIIENFADNLDYSKLYFLRSDIDDYLFRFSESMEAFLENGNLYPAFVIYNDYTNKFKARTEWVLKRLDEPFVFKKDTLFESDRTESQWIETQAEADATWNEFIQYQVLNELLSIAGEPAEDSDEESVNTEALEKQLNRLFTDQSFFDEKMDEVIDKLKRRYNRNLGILEDREVSDIQETFINAMTHAFDPHSSFLSTHTLESFNSAVKNSFVGIGAQLQDVDGICTIKDILPGGPAERSNQLKAEDEILGVAQGDEEFEDVIDMQLQYIVRKIKGPKETVVRLLIRPGDSSDPSARKIVSLVRDEVKLTANLASAKVIYLPGKDSITPIGVIELPSFYGNIGLTRALGTTTDDVQELIEKLEAYDIEGLVLDLRKNGGGLLSEAVRLTGLFIPVGPVVQVVDSRGKKQVLHDQIPAMAWKGPLVILTSRFSASASEIVAGALQDHERALIIGDSTTHGKGTVQEIYHMNSRSPMSWFQSSQSQTPSVASKITIKQFFLPKGSSTQLKGVSSDIILPSVNELFPIAESDLENPIDWALIEPVNWYNNWEKIQVSSPNQRGLMLHLSQLYESRKKEMEELVYLQDQIAWRTQQYDETEISLNLETRISKQLEEKLFNEALEERYDALKENSYEQVEVLLDVRVAQEADSESLKNSFGMDLLNKDSEKTTLDSKSEEEEDEESYDIHLRESLRILRDWVLWENGTVERSAEFTLFPN
ncbi:MAG: carboxy terminal-processing peptidase [Verrucomicrobia bacterium]|nr:carboxy terminal-processing peptidase [Verrucomicrobiota bacterium]